METRKVIIIGSGPAGYTAGLYTARADMKPLLFSGKEPGGQLMQTTDVENWPGDPGGIYGSELMDRMKKHAEKFGTEIVGDTIVEVDFSSRPFKLKTKDEEYQSDTVIIATGASAKWLGIPGEEEFKGKGVSACATCDGFFFKDKKVVLVGGGDAAMEEATFLTKFATEVIVLVRRDELRASKPMQKRALENEKITFMWHTEAKELRGDETLEEVVVVNNQTNEEQVIKANGFFASIGHKPNTDIFVDQLDLDEKGYIKHEPDSTKTSVEGVFACGDVMDPWFRQAITSSGTGCIAALEAERYLSHKE